MEKDDKDLSNVSDEDFGNLDSSSESSDEDIDDDDSSSNDSDDSIDEGSKKKKKKNQKKPAKKPKKAPKLRIIMNVSDTQYDVVKYVGKKVFGWKLSYDKESTDWDMFWTDWAVEPETLARMQTFQKINHFPGMYSLARKNHLGRNLMRMRKNFPDKYKFFPQTFLLPTDYAEFRNQFTKGTTKTFIAKPEASCQGRGIFLTRSPDSIQPGEHFVVQRYLQKPFLIDGLKFDMRIYVLLAGCDPLKVFLYDDGLGRFATETYVAPTGDNLDNVCMHLTNYAINKDNPNFVFNESSSADDVGHKRSLKAVMRTLKEMGHDVDTLWKEIKKIIIKTFCSVQPILAHSYRSCHPDEPYNNMCFELLGFDVMIDHKLRPWLIEVNHTPSFTTDTPLDKSIKKSAIRDALRIMNISVDNKIKAKNKKRIELQQRVLTGKKIKLTPEEKKEAFEKAQQERDAWESKNCGRYEKIYPIDDPSQCDEDYEEYMKFANKWWEEWTGLSIKRNAKRVVDPNKPPPMVFGNGPPVVLPPKVQKQKTIAVNPKPGSGQNSRSYQPDTVQANPEVESKPDKIAAEPNEDAYVPDRSFDEENKNFMAHVAAITETEAVDVIAEDHEEGITERNVKKYVPIRSYNLILSSKADDKQAEIDGNFKLANNMSPSMNALTSSPETKITTKNSSFRIKTMSGAKESPHKSVSEQNINKSEEQRFSVLQKFSNFLNAERVEDLQIAVGAIPTGKGEINTRKIPMKSSNGLSQIWTGPGSLAAMYAHEVERGPRDAGNVLFNKLSARNQHHVNHGKKLVSPSHQYVKSPGNFVAPRLFELNLNGNSKEDAGMKSPVNNVPIGLSSHGSAGSLKGAKVVLGQREHNPHLNPFYDPQAAIQRYYNYLNHIKR